jgi:alpha-tubulin suppressor-like RCC1 family protein
MRGGRRVGWVVLGALVASAASARAGTKYGLSVGDDNTCMLPGLHGGIQCVGRNTHGQLGVGSTTDLAVPTTLTGPVSTTTFMPAAGGENVCLVEYSTGAIVCAGDNQFGQIGDGTTIERHDLTYRVGGYPSTWLAAGSTMCSVETYQLRCWGSNQLGAVGDGTTIDRPNPAQIAPTWTFYTVDTSGGTGHTCAVRVDFATTARTLWCWGNNAEDALGAGPGLGPFSSTPVQVAALGNTLGGGDFQVGVGLDHTCAIKQDGSLWCWGHNEHGQLGDGTTVDSPLPVQVTGLGGPARIVAVSRVGAFTCASTATQILCWGLNDRGQLGDGSTLEHHTPAPVSGLTGSFELRAGAAHACVRDYCWGANEFRQLGDGTRVDRTTPVPFGVLAPVSVPDSTPLGLAALSFALLAVGLARQRRPGA